MAEEQEPPAPREPVTEQQEEDGAFETQGGLAQRADDDSGRGEESARELHEAAEDLRVQADRLDEIAAEAFELENE
jgi:hypothetical protein